jgi:hypothetical protein
MNPTNRRRLAVLFRTVGLSYLSSIAVFLGVLVFTPPSAWFRVLRLVGIGFSVLGATISLVPRALRGTEEIQAQSDTYYGSNPHIKKALLRDTKIAQWGMALILVGFLQQLFGNLG